MVPNNTIAEFLLKNKMVCIGVVVLLFCLVGLLFRPIKCRFCTIESVIFRMGNPGYSYGTSFVISARERLLVTNAHVADIRFESGDLWAVPDKPCACGALQMLKVEQIWYHPKLKRLLDDFVVESTDPADGLPLNPSLDLAVVKLAEGDYQLHNEMVLELIPSEELDNLRGVYFEYLANKKADTFYSMNESERSALGKISRVSGLEPTSSAMLLCTNLSTVEGNSGSPYIMKKNNHVIGAVAWVSNNKIVKLNERVFGFRLSLGVSSHAIVEILDHHNVRIPFVGQKQTFNYKALENRSDIELARKAYAFKRQGLMFVAQANYLDGLRCFDKALEVAPNYASVYRGKAKAVLVVKKNNRQALGLRGSVKANKIIAQCLLNSIRFGGARWESIKLILASLSELCYVSPVGWASPTARGPVGDAHPTEGH